MKKNIENKPSIALFFKKERRRNFVLDVFFTLSWIGLGISLFVDTKLDFNSSIVAIVLLLLLLIARLAIKIIFK